MHSLSEIKESPNFRRLKDSVEYKAERRNTWIIGLFCLILILLMFAAGADGGADSARTVLAAILIIPCFLYQLYRLVRIFFHIDSYTFSEVMLDQPKQGYRGSLYFQIRVRDRYGREFDTDTNRIFGRAEPCFEDYVNQKVLIGYNHRTALTVVIRKLP